MDDGLQWYRRRPRAFLDGVQGMGPELIGAYAVLLDLFYARGGKSLRDDRHLSGVLGCSTRKAKALTDALIESGKVIVRDGFMTNSVVEKEAKSSRTTREAQVNGGRMGSEKRWHGNENKDLPIGRPKTDPSLEKSREEKKYPPTPPKGDDFDEWYSLYPKKVARGAAEKAFKKAIKKADLFTLIAGVRAYASRMAGKDREFIAHPSTWLNQERWLDVDESTEAGKPVSIEIRVDRAKKWLASNDSIPSWMDNLEVAEKLIAEGYDYERLRQAGYSLAPRGKVIEISTAVRPNKI